jgi:hypothetical protein
MLIVLFVVCFRAIVYGAEPPPAVDIHSLPPSVQAAIAAFEHAHSTSEWRRFDTLHEAAVWGADRLERCSHYYECSGYVVVDPHGKYAVGPVRTDYIADAVQIHDQDAPADWTVAADLHSHPCVPRHDTGLFSGPDIEGAYATRTTQFMLDMCTGDVHEFIPGLTVPNDVKDHDGDRWLTAGLVIGHVAAFKDEPIANEGL